MHEKNDTLWLEPVRLTAEDGRFSFGASARPAGRYAAGTLQRGRYAAGVVV